MRGKDKLQMNVSAEVFINRLKNGHFKWHQAHAQKKVVIVMQTKANTHKREMNKLQEKVTRKWD